MRCSNHHLFQHHEWCASDGIHHPNNTVANGILVLGDPAQELRCQDRPVVGQSSPCPHPRKNSSTWPDSTSSGGRRKLQLHVYTVPGFSETSQSNSDWGILGSLWVSVFFLILSVVWPWVSLFWGACKTVTGDLVVLGNRLQSQHVSWRTRNIWRWNWRICATERKATNLVI